MREPPPRGLLPEGGHAQGRRERGARAAREAREAPAPIRTPITPLPLAGVTAASRGRDTGGPAAAKRVVAMDAGERRRRLGRAAEGPPLASQAGLPGGEEREAAAANEDDAEGGAGQVGRVVQGPPPEEEADDIEADDAEQGLLSLESDARDKHHAEARRGPDERGAADEEHQGAAGAERRDRAAGCQFVGHTAQGGEHARRGVEREEVLGAEDGDERRRETPAQRAQSAKADARSSI